MGKSVTPRVKRQVFKLHEGKCASCGVECIESYGEWEDKYYKFTPIKTSYGGYIKSLRNDVDEFDAYRSRRRVANIDHIVPKSKGGSNDISNLQLLCTKCNGGKGCHSQEEFEHMKLCQVIEESIAEELEVDTNRPKIKWSRDAARTTTSAHTRAEWLLEMYGYITKQTYTVEEWAYIMNKYA